MVDLEQPVYIDHIILYIGVNSMYQNKVQHISDKVWHFLTMAVNALSFQ